jgi:Trm5-related predicted tRNA methylase
MLSVSFAVKEHNLTMHIELRNNEARHLHWNAQDTAKDIRKFFWDVKISFTAREAFTLFYLPQDINKISNEKVVAVIMWENAASLVWVPH